jgi:hypothetical protein
MLHSASTNYATACPSLIMTNYKDKKTIIMAFTGMKQTERKIRIHDKILEQINHFKYLGYNISYKVETI